MMGSHRQSISCADKRKSPPYRNVKCCAQHYINSLWFVLSTILIGQELKPVTRGRERPARPIIIARSRAWETGDTNMRRQQSTSILKVIIIIIIASHDNEMNEIYNDKIYMRRSDTMKWVRRFKVPAKANQSILMEAYSQILKVSYNTYSVL